MEKVVTPAVVSLIQGKPISVVGIGSALFDVYIWKAFMDFQMYSNQICLEVIIYIGYLVMLKL